MEHNEVIDILFVNDNANQHPIHIHGHSFWVMSNNIHPGESTAPILRDTFTVLGMGEQE